MQRGPKRGKAARAGSPPASEIPVGTLGDCPADLQGPGRELWADAVEHLTATGQSHRVFRHSLRIVCRLVQTLETDAGLNRLDACRRWLAEMGLTVASADPAAKGVPRDIARPKETGRAKLLRLLDRKSKSA